MAALDPLGASPFFSVAAEISKKKDKKADAQKMKNQAFTNALEKAEVQDQSHAQTVDETGLPSEIQGKSFDAALQYLIDSVYSAGDKLKKEPYTDEFKNYRKILSQFMNFIVKNSYEIEKFNRRGKKDIFTLQVIDSKLDELATGILYNQGDQLKILAKIEEINGILVNFFS